MDKANVFSGLKYGFGLSLLLWIFIICSISTFAGNPYNDYIANHTILYIKGEMINSSCYKDYSAYNVQSFCNFNASRKATNSSGKIGGSSLYFDGSTSSVTFLTTDWGNYPVVAYNNWSVIYWQKLENLAGWRSFFGLWRGATNDRTVSSRQDGVTMTFLSANEGGTESQTGSINLGTSWALISMISNRTVLGQDDFYFSINNTNGLTLSDNHYIKNVSYQIIGSTEKPSDSPRYSKGFLDDLIILDVSINGSLIEYLYNGGQGIEINITPSAPADVYNIDIVLDGLNNSRFQSLEENSLFLVKANYTVNDLEINNASCSFLGNNISAHFGNYNSNDYYMNDSEDIVSIILSEGIASYIYDEINFYVCRNGGTVKLEVVINGAVHKTLNTEIPLCSNGFHQEINRTKAYNTSGINISLRCSSCAGSNTLTVLSDYKNQLLSYERAFIYHSENLNYNSTSKLYEYSSYPYRFTSSGQRYINVSCNTDDKQTFYNVSSDSLIINILSINDETYTDGLNVESINETIILIDVSGDIVTAISFNVTYPNGSLIKSSSTETITLTSDELNIDGIYNITINAVDDDDNSTTKRGYFIVNDSTSPQIYYLNPEETNLSSFEINKSYSFMTLFSDLNLFAFNYSIYDNTGKLFYNNYQTDISNTSYMLNINVIPNVAGTWTIESYVADSHTDSIIGDYEKVIDDKKLNFVFDKSNVSLEYIGNYEVSKIDTVKKTDRYNIDYSFDIPIMPKGDITHSFRLKCPDMYLIENSGYKAHFVCYQSKTWIDFEEDNIISYSLKTCGEDCYDITTVSKPSDKLSFNSIGGLNQNNKTITFKVDNPEVNSFEKDTSDISTPAFLFVLAFLYLGLMYMGFTFKNFGFLSMGFFVGIMLGLFLYSYHIMLTFTFLFLNICIFLGIAKGKI